MRRLHPSTLCDLSDTVAVPAYDRDAIRPGIVHLGLGAFHRAHQAVYTDQAIANSGGDWGIIGVSMRSDAVSQQMSPQGGLYSLLSEDAAGATVSIIGAIGQVVVAPQECATVVAAIARQDIKILTLTVTEKAYCVTADGQTLDRQESSITHDLAAPDTPRSTLGILALGLRERLRAGGAPLTLISCDNLSGNSRLLRSLLQQYLAQTFAEVIPWMNDATAFPCSMVDRIVPAMTESGREYQARLLGVRDEAAVATEPFSQWIVEDCFVTDRPDWASVGVQFVADIAPFEAIKLRLLNASHSAIAFCGLLAGLDTVDQVVADNDLGPFIRRMMNEDLMPQLDVPADFDLVTYRDQLLQRFGNPCLRHRCEQIAMDSSEKISQRWVPALQGANVPLLRKMLSAWVYFVLCTEQVIDDPRREELCAARDSEAPLRDRLAVVLSCARLSPDSVDGFEQIAIAIEQHMDTIARKGLRVLLNT